MATTKDNAPRTFSGGNPFGISSTTATRAVKRLQMFPTVLTASLSLLGAIYVKTAESDDRPTAERRAAWATARDYSQRALAQAEHVESKGMPVRNDTEKKATIQAQLDRCEAAIELLDE